MEERSLKDVTVIRLRTEEQSLKDVTVIRLRNRWRNDH